MLKYYASRLVVTAAVVTALLSAALPWWMAAATGALTLGFFILAPRSGRYVTKAEGGITALRRDERSQAVTDKASRNGFIALMLAAAAAGIYWGLIVETSIPSFLGRD